MWPEINVTMTAGTAPWASAGSWPPRIKGDPWERGAAQEASSLQDAAWGGASSLASPIVLLGQPTQSLWGPYSPASHVLCRGPGQAPLGEGVRLVTPQSLCPLPLPSSFPSLVPAVPSIIIHSLRMGGPSPFCFLPC